MRRSNAAGIELRASLIAARPIGSRPGATSLATGLRGRDQPARGRQQGPLAVAGIQRGVSDSLRGGVASSKRSRPRSSFGSWTCWRGRAVVVRHGRGRGASSGAPPGPPLRVRSQRAAAADPGAGVRRERARVRRARFQPLADHVVQHLESILTDALESRAIMTGPAEAWSFDARIAAAEKSGLIHGGCSRLPAVRAGVP